MDAMKGYRTVLFNGIMTLGMAITVWTGHDTKDEVTALTSNIDLIQGALTAIWGVGNMWLRTITDSPIFKK